MASERKTKVVIVEDDPGQLRLMELLLNNEGYAVESAANGEDGVALVRKVLPAILITDVMLPTLDGFEMCRRLRLDPLTSSIPIIFVTARSSVHDRRAGFDLGADAYLTKPYSLQELLTHIKTVLRRTEGASPGGRVRRPRVLLAGQLSTASVVDVLQTIGWSGISGTLEISSADHGSVELDAGQLVHAQVTTARGRIQGMKAWFRLATWNEGFFELLDHGQNEDRRSPARNISGPLQTLLMDAAYYRDEYDRIRTMFPGFDVVLMRTGDVKPAARIGDRTVWEAVGEGIAVDALLDKVEFTDLEILQATYQLMERGLLVATLSFGR